MDSPNRINQTSITTTVPRQTPQNDFGQVMARTLSGVVQVGAGVAGGLAMGNPVLSAAVSSIAGAASSVASSGGAVTAVGGVPGTVAGTGAGATAGAGGAAGQGSEWELLEAQKLLKADERKFNMAYLDLQNAMQRESREFNAVSNIMKVRHDSAKAAINNIR